MRYMGYLVLAAQPGLVLIPGCWLHQLVILLEDGFGYQESAWEMVLHYTVVRAHLLFPCS